MKEIEKQLSWLFFRIADLDDSDISPETSVVEVSFKISVANLSF